MSYKNIKLAYCIKKAYDKDTKETLTQEIIKNFKKRHIPEGLYLSERNVFNGGFDDARHVFLTSIYNKKPKYVNAQRLSNGQYATTFSMNRKTLMGIPFGNYLTINGKTGDIFVNDNDIKSLNDLVSSSGDNSLNASLYPITNDKRRRYALARKLKNIIENNKERHLGSYHLFGIPGLIQKNNCISIAGGLMSRAGIKPEELPENLGAIGGIKSEDISDYDNLIPSKTDIKKEGAFNYVNSQQENIKKKKKNTNLLSNLFSDKNSEEQLKQIAKEKIIESNPRLWNEFQENDDYPTKDHRGNLITALGTGAGLLYGLGSGFSRSKDDPHFGSPQVLASGIGFGALGLGIATTGELIAKGIGNIAGKYSKPRTPEEQAEYDSKQQIYSMIPGFDTYNAQIRKKLRKKQNSNSNNNNTQN